MPQDTDIVLNGAGYMLVPAGTAGPGGTYERAQDGMAEGRTGRVGLRDFFGGLRRPIQLERDRGYDGVMTGPALMGQGVIPWAKRAGGLLLASPSGVPLPSSGTRIPRCFVNNAVYFARGRYLYRTVVLSATAWAAETLVYDAGTTIVDICPYAGNGILLTYGSVKDIGFWSPATGTETALLAGEKGGHIAAYAGFAIWQNQNDPTKDSYLKLVHGSGTEDRNVDHDIVSLVPAGSKLYVITKSALYSFTGRVKEVLVPNPAWTTGSTEPTSIPGHEWSGDFTPYFQHGIYSEADDFAFFTGYGGRTYTWVAGAVMEDNPNGDRAGWRETGLRGKRCLGGTVAAGYLIVAIESFEGNSELWAWDGSGWWCFGRKPMSGTGYWHQPMALAGAGGYDLLVFHHGAGTTDLFTLAAARPNLPHSADQPAIFTSPIIDAGERDKAKAWRKAGAVFASPERFGNVSSVDAVTVALDYSTDAGATWTTAATATRTGNTLDQNTFTLDADISSDVAVSRFLMLRMRWESVADWAPILTGLWAEFEVLDSPARRRRWKLTVKAEDQVIDRGGSLLTRTGRQLIVELWTAWQAGTTLPFRDLDYDADATERRVRIVGISERVPVPSDAGRWGDSAVTLTLVEV
jgi:hypothetical protein